ncbi:MAG: sulfatase-like hydrolase/transferase [Chloroflexi bacterium]|nr:sulfatase-like hydrolase/transferase [Chloroflexota bacterium]
MAGKHPSVLLVTIDALRADRLGCYGGSRNLSPRIDALAAEGVRFSRAISRSTHTPESFPALMASICPLLSVPLTGQGMARQLPRSIRLISESFQDAGYQTVGIHSNPYLSRAFGYSAGFDTFDDDLKLGGTKLSVQAHRVINRMRARPHMTAEELNARALAWFDRYDGHRPFFAWLHYMDVHGPYLPPDEHLRAVRPAGVKLNERSLAALWRRAKWHPETVTDDERALLIDLYDAEVRSTDTSLGRLLDELERRGQLGETVLAITSDHGEEFGEHGRYDHPNDLYEELLRVPLILRLPGQASAGMVHDGVVPTSDLAPTLLEAAKLPREPRHMGRGLLRLVNGGAGHEHVICEVTGEFQDEGLRKFAVVTATHKYETAFSGDQRVRELLRDFRSDPGETRDFAAEQPDLCRELTGVLDAHLARFHARGEPEPAAVAASADSDALSAEVEERLRGLGYIE